MSLSLNATLAAWGTPDFAATFKREFEALPAACLPLQQGLAYSSMVADEAFHALLIGTQELPDELALRVGVMYAGIIAGCNCADDPTPPVTQTEYCVLDVRIRRADGGVQVKPAPDV
ncbi:MAG: hypothetical protein LDL16_02275 [Thiobacillus sp.]|nr:hypothetical protein [Thiobacillus sp.]